MKFSVIIPTRNRPQSLAACLRSFCRLDYPPGHWEIIVVNDGGAESFAALNGELQMSLPLQLVCVEHAGPASARNAGARLAQGEILAFTDDDCRVAHDWLQAYSRGFASGDYDALGGRCRTPENSQPAERAWQHLVDFLYDFMRNGNGDALLLMSNNVAYRRDVFELVGGFDESFPLAAAEDMELSYRLIIGGYRQRHYPEAQVWHHQRLTPSGHLSQQFRYGRGGHYFARMPKKRSDESVAELYSQSLFYPALIRSMRVARLPYPSALLVLAGQIAYQLGLHYQAVRDGR